MNTDHLHYINHRTVFKDECFIKGTREYDTLQHLLTKQQATSISVGLEPIAKNADPGDLVVLLFPKGVFGDTNNLYNKRYNHAHVCVVQEKDGKPFISDFYPETKIRRLSNFSAQCVRIIKQGTNHYDTILGLCFHQLAPSVTPIPGIPKSL